MKKRKLISTILALLLALQFIVPAFASEGAIPPETGETVEEILPPEIPEEALPEMPPEDPVPQEPEDDPQTPVDNPAPEDVPGDVQEPGGEPGLDDIQAPADAEEPPEAAEPLEDLIDVLVPSTGQMVINPYHLPVDLDGGESQAQIVHAPQTLANRSDFPVTVNVAVIGTISPGSEAVFVPAPPPPDAPGKDVFLYAEFSNQYDWWEQSFFGLPCQVPVSEWGTIGENVLTLDAHGEGYFRLSGAMAENPLQPWSDTDTFGAVLTFTFTPVYTDGELMENAGTQEEAPPVETEIPEAPAETPPTEAEIPEAPIETPPVAPEVPEEPADPEIPEAPEETPPADPEIPEAPVETPPVAPEVPEVPVETPPAEAEGPEAPEEPASSEEPQIPAGPVEVPDPPVGESTDS